MDISTFLAQVFGLYLVIVSPLLFFKYDAMQGAMSDLVKDRGTLLLMAFITLILGILLVLSHNLWVADWRIVITLLCWLVLISGIIRLYCPNCIEKYTLNFIQNKKACAITSGVTFLLGLFLVYHGFF